MASEERRAHLGRMVDLIDEGFAGRARVAEAARQYGRVTEAYSDLNGPLTKDEYELGGRRIAALVALCEEVLDEYEGFVWDNRGTGQPAVDAWIKTLFERQRQRLAQLKGQG